MKKIVILLFVLLFVFSVSAERYIIETEGDLDSSLQEKVVDKIEEPILKQVAKSSIGGKISTKFVVEASEEELLEHEEIIYFEKNLKVKAIDINWNYDIIGVDFSEIEESFGQGVRIAILDTGVNYDLLDINSGYDFVNEDNDSYDDNGHGTWVSQVLRLPGTQLPLIGAEIYAVKVLDENGEGYMDDAIEGINWAIDNEIDIVLMSFGGEEELESYLFEEAVNLAYDSGILLIAAMGNTGDEFIIYPAGYDSVISVGSINEGYGLSYFSCYGESQELVAPGENIIVTDGVYYYFVSGTSFSVPHVGIVAAGYWGENPEMSNQEIRNKLHETALDLGEAGKDDLFGWGLARYVEVQNAPENLSEKIQLLESRVDLLEEWKELIIDTLSEIWLSITGLAAKTEELENRIEILENQTVVSQVVNYTHPYFKYSSSSYRKKMVCGYAEENHLEHYEDLGWSCDLTYRELRSGRESVRCRCEKIE